MWEAFFAIHISTGQRRVRPLAVIFLAPLVERAAHIFLRGFSEIVDMRITLRNTEFILHLKLKGFTWHYPTLTKVDLVAHASRRTRTDVAGSAELAPYA